MGERDKLKEYRKLGSIKKGSDLQSLGFLSTGIKTLDHALKGGIPKGSILEIFGTTGSGKTSLSYSLMSELQKLGKKAILFNAENRYDSNHASINRVDTSKIEVISFVTAEQAFDIATEFYHSDDDLGMVVFDSVAALSTKALLEKTAEDNFVDPKAKMIGHFINRVGNLNREKEIVLVFLNQLRSKVGVTWGSPETRPGGSAIPFLSSTSLDMRRVEVLKEDKEIVGIMSKIKIHKGNGCTGLTTTVPIRFNSGIDYASDTVDYLVGIGEIDRSGAIFTYKGEKYRGRKEITDFIGQQEAPNS